MKNTRGVRRHRQAQSAHSGVDALRSVLAHVRARFGLDPAVPDHLLADAWISPAGAVEEDEAEFVDAVADCVSVGVPLDAALAAWVSGDLAGGEDAEEQADVIPVAAIRLPAKDRIVVR